MQFPTLLEMSGQITALIKINADHGGGGNRHRPGFGPQSSPKFNDFPTRAREQWIRLLKSWGPIVTVPGKILLTICSKDFLNKLRVIKEQKNEAETDEQKSRNRKLYITIDIYTQREQMGGGGWRQSVPRMTEFFRRGSMKFPQWFQPTGEPLKLTPNNGIRQDGSKLFIFCLNCCKDWRNKLFLISTPSVTRRYCREWGGDAVLYCLPDGGDNAAMVISI
jgi:hypothetical protein